MEALARGVFQALGIHSSTREDGLVLRGEVFADYGDDANICEVTRGEWRNRLPRPRDSGRACPWGSRWCQMQHCLRQEWT